MKTLNRPFESPAWAGRVLSAVGLLTFLCLLAALAPAWRARLTRMLGVGFGLFWSLFGLFTLAFKWALPRRGGGFISPDQTRWLWLVIAFGSAVLGGITLYCSLPPLIQVGLIGDRASQLLR